MRASRDVPSRPAPPVVRLLVVVMAAGLAVAACALLGKHGGGGGDEDAPVKPEITLEVNNQDFYDATVYALSRSGERQRLGTVTGNAARSFTFRWLYDEIRVIIDLVGAGSTVSQPMLVSPGDTLGLTVEPDLHLKIPNF